MPAPRRAAEIPQSALLAAIVVATIVAFSPLLQNGFVNWDDPDALEHNAHLSTPGTVAWAFTTTHMSHYQPLSWIAWSVVARQGGQPSTFHALSLIAHLLNIVLVAWLAVRLAAGLRPPAAALAGLTAAVFFGLHPLRVEPVAWASAFPYVLSTMFLLLATIGYVNWLERRGVWLAVSVVFYLVSTLARPIAPALPLVLAAIDRCHVRWTPASVRTRIVSKLPFFALTVLGLALEANARPLAPLAEIGWMPRLTAAVTAPFFYLWQTAAPLTLSPLRPLPLQAHTDTTLLLAGIAGLTVVTAVCILKRTEYPALLAGWFSYLVLLAPAVGLTPSGLQATADRYTYVPSIALGVALAMVCARWVERRQLIRPAMAALALIGVACMVGVRQQTGWWRDSITLWTRAAALDPANDVALYNLGVALAADGRNDEAEACYGRTLELVPDHGPAKQNLSLLQATRYQRQADSLAASGDFEKAMSLYDQAIARDPARLLAVSARGIAALQLGQLERAHTDLQKAWDGGVRDAATANSLAFLLIQKGAEQRAGVILREALTADPESGAVTGNLARLLATANDSSVRDPALAVKLAQSASAAVGDTDPRLLDTLAAAYAGAGDVEHGRDASRRAVALARSAGDRELAARIEANWRRYAAAGSPPGTARRNPR